MQVSPQGFVLASPDEGVCIESCPVHQKRGYVFKVTAQLIQDAKTMSIDVAPVMD